MATEEPTTLELVKVQLDIDAEDTDDDVRLGPIVAAVNRVIRRLPVAEGITGTIADPEADPPVEADSWPDDVRQGATMLASRLWKRKNSPAGVEALGTDGPLYVRRNDPDIAMLLQLGDWSEPSVG